MRVLAGALCVAALVGGASCDPPVRPPTELERGAAYVDSAAYRREVLVASLANPGNGYATLRLERYTDARWGALPVWRPRVRPVRVGDLGAGVPVPDASWTALDTDVPWTDAALRELGARAFTDYPNQIEPALVTALADAGAPARFGLWTAGDRVGGLVWVELPGGVQPAFTCSSCHATVDDADGLRPGVPNHGFDYGALLDAHRATPTAGGRWGPGRVDVSGDDREDPIVIADLRAVRFQERLHRAATLVNDLPALAVRIETGVITATGEAVRPPRELAFAVAWYLWGLGEALPEGAGDGAEVFARECAGCHGPPGLAGPPIALDLVGTDPTIGASPSRGTGRYQTPSLRGVASRGWLMAGGDVPSLEALLDGDREAPGHRYGTDLDAAQREALLGYLRRLE